MKITVLKTVMLVIYLKNVPPPEQYHLTFRMSVQHVSTGKRSNSWLPPEKYLLPGKCIFLTKTPNGLNNNTVSLRMNSTLREDFNTWII
jgi:hypothetical protein